MKAARIASHAAFLFLVVLVGSSLYADTAQAQPRGDQHPGLDRVRRLALRFNTFAFVPNDPKQRVAYGTDRGIVYVLEYDNGYYRKAWSSPSMVTRVQEVQIVRLKRGDPFALVAYNTRGFLHVYSLDGYSPIWESPETQFESIEALTTAQLDSDPQFEIVFLSRGRLYIYDGAYFHEEWRSDQIFGGTDIVVGDVDGDDEAEIILNTGFVLDGLTRTLEWESVEEFGNVMELADIDGDRKLELIGGNAKATKIWDIDMRREKWE